MENETNVRRVAEKTFQYTTELQIMNTGAIVQPDSRSTHFFRSSCGRTTDALVHGWAHAACHTASVSEAPFPIPQYGGLSGSLDPRASAERARCGFVAVCVNEASGEALNRDQEV